MFPDTPDWGPSLGSHAASPPRSGLRASTSHYAGHVKEAWNKGQETTSESLMSFIAWSFGRISPSVLSEIWPHVFFFAAVGTAVTCINKFTDLTLEVEYTALSMIATVVAFVCWFHAANCYNHWWEGRVIWSNIASNCRSLVSLIWLYVPNEPRTTVKDRDERDEKATKSDAPRRLRRAERKRRTGTSHDWSTGEDTDSTWWSGKWRQSAPSTTNFEGDESPKTPAGGNPEMKQSYFDIKPKTEEPLDDEPRDSTFKASTEEVARPGYVKFADIHAVAPTKEEAESPNLDVEEDDAEQGQGEDDSAVAGMVEKKTFVGLIQAYAVALKHSLRGERGPFYSDLYPLISFLPKYNTCIPPPFSRDQLFPLWQNGLPQAEWHKPNDFAAIPLTAVATYDGYMINVDTGMPMPAMEQGDKEYGPDGMTTNTADFTNQAMEAASWYAPGGREAVGFVPPIHHRQGHDVRFVHPEPKGRIQRGARLGSYGQRVNMTTVELMPPRHPPPPKVWDYITPLRVFKVIADRFRSKEQLDKQLRVKGGHRKRRQVGVKAEIAHEMLLYLMAYSADLNKRGLVDSFFPGMFMSHITELQKALSDLEKIANTPIPPAYRSHTRMVIWAWLFFLPLQIYPMLGWITIPAITLISMTYLGYLEVGSQLERPFGYEKSDLDLDWFCILITSQIQDITAFPTALPCREIIRHKLNQPFGPAMSLSAVDILGTTAAVPQPNSKGFAASYTEAATSLSAQAKLAPIRNVRDLEVAAMQNARESEIQAGAQLAQPWTEMEHRTGQEVAVLAI